MTKVTYHHDVLVFHVLQANLPNFWLLFRREDMGEHFQDESVSHYGPLLGTSISRRALLLWLDLKRGLAWGARSTQGDDSLRTFA